MLNAKARDAVKQAKAARDAVNAMMRKLKMFCYFDGPRGVGNL
jgi:hypothetical protein